LRVDVIPSRYEELPIPGHGPRELALAHARGKAAGAAASSGLIVAADTVVDLDGTALGKPANELEWRHMLERLAERSHLVHTAFALRVGAADVSVVHCETTRVHFGAPSPATITTYIASGDGLDKAGGYGIQGFAATLVERIEGDYFTVVGFPLAAFARTLPTLGYVLEPPARAVAGVMA
jgi:septum formation protein